MSYVFDEAKFKEHFNTKTEEEKSKDALRLTHKVNNEFKLFPYKASGKSQAPIISDLSEIVSGFFRKLLDKESKGIDIDSMMSSVKENVDIDDEDFPFIKEMITELFFKNGNFCGNTMELYPYQSAGDNRSAEQLAIYLYSVFDIGDEEKAVVNDAKKQYNLNVLEELVVNSIENVDIENKIDDEDEYFQIKNNIGEKFKNDFHFMIRADMTSIEDISNLLSIYYFYYVSQTCITLDHFCTGKRDNEVKLYFALDWEKVSKNRLCCTEGWNRLQNNISHMFSHAVTLEILNQTTDDKMRDYISFANMVDKEINDETLAKEIKHIEDVYCSYIGDFKKFDAIDDVEGSSLTEKNIIHLYRSVEEQFINTERKRANQFYNEKFSGFCKERWLKNRRKAGLVLNLSESDIIFLTKICIKNQEKIRLNDLYKEYEYRGIYIDNTSKEYLQDYFTKLNLIDKKSDSGDAQYVKRIL